jgi:hypothetical protein
LIKWTRWGSRYVSIGAVSLFSLDRRVLQGSLYAQLLQIMVQAEDSALDFGVFLADPRPPGSTGDAA